MGMAVLMDTAGCRSNAVLRRKPAFRLSTAVGLRDTRYGDYDRRLLGTLPSMEHVMAQEEVKSLLRQLKLPIDERGRRRAANRAEWFNQVNKPLEVHDIFSAPQIGFQTGDRLGPRS